MPTPLRPQPNIKFEEATHKYTVDGTVMRSVTQILDQQGYISKFCKNKEASERGSRWHKLLENYDKGRLILDLLSGEEKQVVTYYSDFLKEVDPKFSHIEHPVCRLDLGYAGLVDRLSEICTCIADIKTGTSVPDSGKLQTAGYAVGAFNDPYSVERYCIHINPRKRKKAAIKYYHDKDDIFKWIEIAKKSQRNRE